MRAKFLTLASVTALGILALTSVQSTAQAEEGYRHRSIQVEHRDRDHNRAYSSHSDNDRGWDHDRR